MTIAIVSHMDFTVICWYIRRQWTDYGHQTECPLAIEYGRIVHLNIIILLSKSVNCERLRVPTILLLFNCYAIVRMRYANLPWLNSEDK